MPFFEEVVGSNQPLPDALMNRYGVDGQMQVAVTPVAVAELAISSLGAALMLAELHQRAGRHERAIELLESLGSIAGEPTFALSLAELYSERSGWDDVIRVSAGFQNQDDARRATCVR